MADSKLYLTLLVYLQGEVEKFLEYEDLVLPLLAKYNGELLYRIRPEASNFIQPAAEHPYEIHLISFASAEDFQNYRQDKERLAHFPLFQQSVRKVLLLQGAAL